MKKLFIVVLLVILFFQIGSSSVLARKSSFGSYKYTAPKYVAPRIYAPKTNSNPKYIVPRQQIPVLKTQQVRPYLKNDGAVVSGYQRAPSGSLKPWYNIFHW